ncbi:family 16 glycosylhydrolase [Streptomyces sp. NRRL B-3648]|uniref:family 16 glycosylhydrolase n=1 Tax=Streptomyces sp. NRRL B-3648 TaxID=1519493 RepID=UPI0006B0176D|nr:family 16 glycosylhydrolase [Streptomyces sp. NRRL B-3648]KOV96120.1 beta-glucanase [Streptomyces sp. NRRL B-3648]
MDESTSRGPLPGPRVPPPPDVVFTADFASETQWVAGRSWAYPGGGPVNPGDNKLDYLVPDAEYSRSGVFRATRRPDGWWDTGLLTTEGSQEEFTVRTGDVLEARVRLPEEVGAWPAIWTWRDGDQEVDVFEYHPDNPDLLEFSNHVRGGSRYLDDDAVQPGAWVDLRTEFGARSVVWWLNGTQVFADGRGVGRSWHAYLIVNLSVSAGRYHPSPDPGTTEMSFEVASLVVRRPSAGGSRHAGTGTGAGDEEREPADS